MNFKRPSPTSCDAASAPSNPQMEPTRQTVCAIMSQRRAAHLDR